MNKQKDTYTIIGLMSGTSLDGLDLCACEFTHSTTQWKFKILGADTIPYSKEWESLLLEAEECSARKLIKIHCLYGKYLGKIINQFIQAHNLKVDLISSHGHTIFHQAEAGYTLQIGHGGFICEEVGLPVVSDFRSQDIAAGGQGAPLVPFGEKLLFPEYNYFLNLGGIANLSIHQNNNCIAFDVSAANIVLNYISQRYFNKNYDDRGTMAQEGTTDISLLKKLNNLAYFKRPAPKSLGKEDIYKWLIPLIESSNIPAKNKLNTFITHLCEQIEASIIKLSSTKSEPILISGGGTFNSYLVKELQKRLNITIPNKAIINYKEALIFAFLGLYRLLGKKNTLSSVTGARRDVCAGNIFIP